MSIAASQLILPLRQVNLVRMMPRVVNENNSEAMPHISRSSAAVIHRPVSPQYMQVAPVSAIARTNRTLVGTYGSNDPDYVGRSVGYDSPSGPVHSGPDIQRSYDYSDAGRLGQEQDMLQGRSVYSDAPLMQSSGYTLSSPRHSRGSAGFGGDAVYRRISSYSVQSHMERPAQEVSFGVATVSFGKPREVHQSQRDPGIPHIDLMQQHGTVLSVQSRSNNPFANTLEGSNQHVTFGAPHLGYGAPQEVYQRQREPDIPHINLMQQREQAPYALEQRPATYSEAVSGLVPLSRRPAASSGHGPVFGAWPETFGGVAKHALI